MLADILIGKGPVQQGVSQQFRLELTRLDCLGIELDGIHGAPGNERFVGLLGREGGLGFTRTGHDRHSRTCGKRHGTH